MSRLAIHICGLPAPEDDQWHRLGYLEHKCGCCRYAAQYVRRQPSEPAEYRCAECKKAQP